MIFNRSHPHAGNSGRQAFTLVELLVAMAVLSILVAVLAQVVSLTSQAIDINSRKLDVAGQARLFFDRLGADLAASPQRTDLGLIVNKVNGSDNIALYTAANGYVAGKASSSGRELSLVSYQIGLPPPGAGSGPICLIREADAMDWTPTGPTAVSFLAPPSFTPITTPPIPISANADVMASGIFRLEYCYLLKTGANAGKFANTLVAGDEYSAIVVAVAGLDGKSMNLLTNNNNPSQIGQVATLANDLDDSTANNDPLSTWNTQLAVPGFGGSKIPRKVIQSIRLFQRTFYAP